MIFNKESMKIQDDDLEKIAPLKEIKKFQILRYEMLQLEAIHLERTLGKDHERVKRLKVQTRKELDVLRQIDKELELSNIRTPDVPSGGVLIHGQVIDKPTDKGMAGCLVFAQDDKGNAIKSIEQVETNSAGYFAIPIENNVLADSKKQSVYLVVATLRGKIVHREKKPITLEQNSKVLINFTLERKPFSSPAEVNTPAANKVSDKQGRDNVSGKADEVVDKVSHGEDILNIDIKDLKGIGPKVARKLYEADIKNLCDFVKTSDEKLQELVGKRSLTTIKKQNDSLIKKIKNHIQ